MCVHIYIYVYVYMYVQVSQGVLSAHHASFNVCCELLAPCQCVSHTHSFTFSLFHSLSHTHARTYARSHPHTHTHMHTYGSRHTMLLKSPASYMSETCS